MGEERGLEVNHVDSRFEDSDVELDGNVFERCTFLRCRMIYRGGDFPSLTNNNFDASSLFLDDAAARTITFLGKLYHGGARPWVDGILNVIYQGPDGPSGTVQ